MMLTRVGFGILCYRRFLSLSLRLRPLSQYSWGSLLFSLCALFRWLYANKNRLKIRKLEVKINFAVYKRKRQITTYYHCWFGRAPCRTSQVFFEIVSLYAFISDPLTLTSCALIESNFFCAFHSISQKKQHFYENHLKWIWRSCIQTKWTLNG